MIEKNDIIELKSTRGGVSVIVNADCDFPVALQALEARLVADQDFFARSGAILDVGWRELRGEQIAKLETVFADCGVMLLGIISMSLATRNAASARGHVTAIGRVGIGSHIANTIEKKEEPGESIPSSDSITPAPTTPAPGQSTLQAPAAVELSEVEVLKPSGENAKVSGQEPTVFIRRTLRSGQSVFSEGNIVVVGDVNPGASLEAEGDVIVLGSLRGQAHAGCSGNTNCTINAAIMQPTQLRIGTCIWVAPSSRPRSKTDSVAMRAKVSDERIVLEPYKA